MGRDKIPFHFSSLGRSHSAAPPPTKVKRTLTWGQNCLEQLGSGAGILSCSSALCFVSLAVTESLCSLAAALVSHRSAKEFRPATYKLRDLRQVIGPLSLGFSDSDVRPAGT